MSKVTTMSKFNEVLAWMVERDNNVPDHIQGLMVAGMDELLVLFDEMEVK